MDSFVKEIVIMPEIAEVPVAIPIPAENPIGGRDTEEATLNGSNTSIVKFVD